jgi:hypothetical protein
MGGPEEAVPTQTYHMLVSTQAGMNLERSSTFFQNIHRCSGPAFVKMAPAA